MPMFMLILNLEYFPFSSGQLMSLLIFYRQLIISPFHVLWNIENELFYHANL